MTIDSADDSKISNWTINTNRISNRTYDSKSNRITKLRRSLVKRPNQQYQSTEGNATKDKPNNKIHKCTENNGHKKGYTQNKHNKALSLQ